VPASQQIDQRKPSALFPCFDLCLVGLKALIRNLCVTQIEIECQAKLWNIYHFTRAQTKWAKS